MLGPFLKSQQPLKSFMANVTGPIFKRGVPGSEAAKSPGRSPNFPRKLRVRQGSSPCPLGPLPGPHHLPSMFPTSLNATPRMETADSKRIPIHCVYSKNKNTKHSKTNQKQTGRPGGAAEASRDPADQPFQFQGLERN